MLTMLGFIFVLGLLAVLAVPVLVVVAAVALVLKLVFGILLLPFRIAFWGISGIVKVAGLLLAGTLGVVLVGGIAALGFGLILVPLLPLLLLGGLAWIVYRLLRPARAA